VIKLVKMKIKPNMSVCVRQAVRGLVKLRFLHLDDNPLGPEGKVTWNQHSLAHSWLESERMVPR
jgi:hypothetical protein